MIAELADDNSVAKAYTFGNDLISQTDLSTSNTSYFHYYGQGNTRNLSDTNGLSDSYTFDAFGTSLNTSGSTDNNYLYSGEQFDAELDNYYLRARYYDQGVGRFTQMDTWMGRPKSPITLNKYIYADAEPLNKVDTAGNFSIASTMRTGEPVAYSNGYIWNIEKEQDAINSLIEIQDCIEKTAFPFFEYISNRQKLIDFMPKPWFVDNSLKEMAKDIKNWTPN